MVQHRSYSIEFKRQVAQEFLGGGSPSPFGPTPQCSAEPLAR